METKFGFEQLSVKTPMWARWTFRITSLVTLVLSFWVVSSSLTSPLAKAELVLLFKSIDMLVLGLSNMFGEHPKTDL